MTSAIVRTHWIFSTTNALYIYIAQHIDRTLVTMTVFTICQGSTLWTLDIDGVIMPELSL